MTDYPFDMQLVVDPTNPSNVVQDGEVSLYDPTDVAGSSPLSLKDPSGLPILNPLLSNAHGFLQPFIATVPQVMWKSGTYQGYFNSYVGMRDEAIAARTAAQEAAGSAADSAALVDAPADEIMAATLEGPSQTRTAVETAISLYTEEQVPPLVTEALAADDAPAQAAAAAVAAKAAQLGVFTGAFQIIGNDTVALSFVDQKGNRSWLEIGFDGLPTPESVTLMVQALLPALNSAVMDILDGQPGQFRIVNDGSGLRVSFVDSEGKRSWLEVGADGGPTDHTIAQIQSRLIPPEADPPTLVAVSYDSELIKTASGPDICLYGDSMTAADWASTLAALTGRTVIRCGVGGETSAGIAARANAMPFLMLPLTGEIPASGGVTVTLTSSGGGSPWPLLQGSGTPDGMAMGTLAGIPGRMTIVRDPNATQYLHHTGDTYVFTRTTDGAAVPVTRPMPFYYDNGEARRGDIWVIWSGRNNFATDNGDRAFADIKAMTNYMKALDRRFLVLAVHNGTGEGIGTTNYPLITGLNTRLLKEYGRRFVDHRRYLIDYGLADLGITPTAQDTADIAADTVPQSLRTDTIHQTEQARTVTASQVNLRLREMGWV